MPNDYYIVNWDLHKNHMTNGFSHFQQNEEFVDMTLAAEGHLVKVHQNIIALASPYIKQMLQFASCPHPVVFLNNVSYKVLSYILEYIYLGEVQVPTDMMNSFVETSKALSVKGIEDMLPVNKTNETIESDHNDETELNVNIQLEDTHTASNSNYAACITINSNNYQVDVHKFSNEENLFDINDKQPLNNIEMKIIEESKPLSETDFNNTNIATCCTDTNTLDIENLMNPTNNDCQYNDESGQISTNMTCVKKDDINIFDLTPVYTKSNKGALQLILNRYMYYCHHESNKGRKRRWRCIDYRRSHCSALIDTMDGNILRRIGMHNHNFHDNKIVKKYEKKGVYSSIIKGDEKDKNEETAFESVD